MTEPTNTLTAQVTQRRTKVAEQLFNISTYVPPYVEAMNGFLTVMTAQRSVGETAEVRTNRAVQIIGSNTQMAGIQFHSHLLKAAYALTEPYMDAIGATEPDKSTLL